MSNFWTRHLAEVGHCLGERNNFADSLSQLIDTANRLLPQFNGGNGRYRCAKVIDLSNCCQAVLTLAPRYENTDMVLQLLDFSSACSCPVYPIALDHDWDENARSQLRSFLHYC